MKPEEAKHKYCPFEYYRYCRAKDCMAWVFNCKKQEGKPNEYKYPYEVDTEDGYCKLIDK